MERRTEQTDKTGLPVFRRPYSAAREAEVLNTRGTLWYQFGSPAHHVDARVALEEEEYYDNSVLLRCGTRVPEDRATMPTNDGC